MKQNIDRKNFCLSRKRGQSQLRRGGIWKRKLNLLEQEKKQPNVRRGFKYYPVLKD